MGPFLLPGAIGRPNCLWLALVGGIRFRFLLPGWNPPHYKGAVWKINKYSVFDLTYALGPAYRT